MHAIIGFGLGAGGAGSDRAAAAMICEVFISDRPCWFD
jgi:hypothetical protein